MERAVYRKAGGMILAQLQVPTGLNFATIDLYKYCGWRDRQGPQYSPILSVLFRVSDP
jgi:hypothetical protein